MLSMRWRLVAPVLLGLLSPLLAAADAAPPISGPESAPAAAFTPAQRQEVVEILRHALATDPTILRDAVLALQASEQVAHAQDTTNAIARLRPALVADPQDAVAGNPQGDVTVVEFYDTRCPYCRRMTPDIDALLKADPKLKFVMKDIPILGPASVLQSRALLAAQKQGGYFALQRALMAAPPGTGLDGIAKIATGLGLDWPRLHRDMDAPEVQQRIEANLALARELGVNGTPAFVVGDHLVPGAVDLAALQQVVAEARGQ